VQIELFAQSPVGSLVPISGYDPRFNEDYEHWAFVPDPLPSEVSLSTDTWTLASEATLMLGRLKEASSRLPNPSVFRTPALRREAVSTSALEGTYAPFEDVLEAEAEPDVPRSPQVREILNYVTAANYAFNSLADRGFTFSLLAEAQGLLVRGTSGERPDTGRLRETIVIIGPEDARVPDARFIPPPEDDRLRAGVDEWTRWVNDPPRLPVVVECALSHYQFETLHPFSDGNGRIGRLAIVLELMIRGVLGEPVLTLSPWFEARRELYQTRLLSVSMDGDWDSWVAFFATAVLERSQATIEQIASLEAWKVTTLDRLREARIMGVARELAETLISGIPVTARSVSESYNVTPQAAHHAINRLEEVGVLQRLSPDGAYRHVWYAPDVLHLTR
jgi:Fic family protein